MMIFDALNLHVYPARTKMTAMKKILNTHDYSTGESELKEFLVDETLSQICSTDEDKQKGIIVNECYAEED